VITTSGWPSPSRTARRRFGSFHSGDCVLAGFDLSKHVVIYLPNPKIGIGIQEEIVGGFGQASVQPRLPG
jgi:hypothetical protein